jgi:two-component system chemotaxis response regulator CheY
MKRIVIVDDSPVVRNVMQGALDAAGFQVHVASNREELKSAIDANDPDLVLLDVDMPDSQGDMIGLVLRVIRRMKKPLYLLSSLAPEELERRAKAAEVDGWISKQSGTPAVVARVHRILGVEGDAAASGDRRARALERGRHAFFEEARPRVARALEGASRDDAASVFAELHAFAGEAALVGLDDLARRASDGEAIARKWKDDAATAGRSACEAVLRDLDAHLASLPDAAH